MSFSLAANIRKVAIRSRAFVTELVLIVCGILIALAIDSWKDDIDDARRERATLQQLIADLQATMDSMAAADADTAASDQAALDLVEAFGSGAYPSLDELRHTLGIIGYANDPVPVLGTAETLVSTGDLRIVRNPEHRLGITRYISRSRDFWLVPIYQLEQRHGDLYGGILLQAAAHGITPGNRMGPVRGSGGPDIEGFFASVEAYAMVARLAEVNSSMKQYRAGMASDAEVLKRLLEAQ